ncbi:MAG: TRAP transporter small permease [Desulfobacula sp.]|jgi:TRAP-type C4-dicarboxylate transport system permease small subunit|uniref:TRAP transporter small permease subunit n=1 Tax=Desulfobacula sp. TaxID=2593537 RepID=UPI001D42D1A5|nr:TRAP transporter small permease [Desulfobacula sp.]MBT4027615.1 TRAP transporter small permease [Desulfobacula sp.]MBT6339716.1 TRAP transporter small permease [Desulfobacula sp.]MBT7260640.1 TRAP transporter small permease [Desulfobacula sp.]
MGLIKKLEKISSGSVIMCGLLLVGMSLFIALEVILRKFFFISTKGADELSAYTFAIVCAWSLSYTLIKKGHIRIDFLYAKLPFFIQRILDVVAFIALATFVSPMTYYTFKTLKTSIVRFSKANTPLQTPMWIPQILWFSGLLFFFIVVIVFTLMILKMAFKKQFKEMAEFAGCPVLEEEIKEESGIDIKGIQNCDGDK